jgi:hypothetical protein
MTLVLDNGTRTELVQCADCDEYAIQDQADGLGWVTNRDGDWKCGPCFHAWVY